MSGLLLAALGAAGLAAAFAVGAPPAAAQEDPATAGAAEEAGDAAGDRSFEEEATRTDLDRAEELEERVRAAEADEPQAIEAAEAAEPGVPPADDHALPTESAAFRDAYQRLENAEAAGDIGEVDDVKDFFEDEIEAGRNVARAHNALGRAFMVEHDHVITVLESIQKLFNWDHITQARQNFRRAVEVEPGYVAAWYNWALAGRKARDDDALREAAVALRKVVALDPSYRETYRLLVVTLRDLEDDAGAEKALAEWRASAAVNPALANLEESYLRMGIRGEDAAGARLYWEGLAAARTLEEVDAYYADLKLVVSKEEAEAYADLDPERRKAWIADFWQRAADEAVVTRDERLAEHYRRLSHVERTFALTIPQRRHYSAISAYRPREQSGFDDRGLIYLRHGEPDEVARFTGPNVQRNESWRYARADGDLVFHFVSDEDTEDFKLVNSLADALVRGNATLGLQRNSAENVGELFQSRSSFDPIYNRLAFQFDPMLLREEEEDVARDVKVGVSTESYVPAAPDSLPFYAYPAAFRAPSGGAELSLFFGVPTSELEMPAGESGTRVAYAAQMLLEDPDGDAVQARAADSTTAQVPRALPREAGVLVPDVLKASVPEEGTYRYRLRVRDLFSRDTGTLSGELQVPDFRGFSASTLVLASKVEPGSGGGKFSRGALKVVPLPSLAFRPGQPVFAYYELYGMTPGEDGRLRYVTEYTVRALERKRNIAVKLVGAVGNLIGSRKERAEEVGLSVEGEAAPAERLQEYIALDLNESEPGPYEIVVQVEDRATGKKVERSAAFVLVE